MSKLFFLLCLISVQTYGQSNIDQYLQDLNESGSFNGVALVSIGDQDLIEKAYGLADPDNGKMLNSESRFGIGSIYKEFPAVAIMYLVEKGQLEVSDLLSKHVKDLPSWSDSITVENLIRYNSGLPQIP